MTKSQLRSVVFRAQATELAPDMGPAASVLLDEACRILDRLDRLGALLDGDVEAWVRVRVPTADGDDLVLRVDGALAEARAQSAELRQVLKSLDLPSQPAAAAEPTKLELLLGGGASG